MSVVSVPVSAAAAVIGMTNTTSSTVVMSRTYRCIPMLVRFIPHRVYLIFFNEGKPDIQYKSQSASLYRILHTVKIR